MKQVKQDNYELITNAVLAQMQTAGANWVNPFNRKGEAGRPTNIVSKKAYRGINTLLLTWTPFASQHWGTYKQWADKGCQVRKGSKSTRIIFWQFIEKVEQDGTKKTIPMLRTYSVFNREQVDGTWAESLDAAPQAQSEVQVIEAADKFFQATGASIRYSNQGRAFYSPSEDFIHMPNREVFEATPTSTATECFYSTQAHEVIHWTGHKSRLDRLKLTGFGSEEYAFEELVAELGAAILCGTLGISTSPRPDHAQYLNSWMKALKNDKRMFVKAAGLAGKAVDFLTRAEDEQEEVQDAA